MRENYIALVDYIRTNDRVRFHGLTTLRRVKNPGLVEGLEGTVVEFTTQDVYVGRNQQTYHHLRPGYYTKRYLPVVEWDNGLRYPQMSDELAFVDESLYVVRCGDLVGKAEANRTVFHSKLPDTPYWEGDYVSVRPSGNWTGKPVRAQIETIDYPSFVRAREAGYPALDCYTLSPADDPSGLVMMVSEQAIVGLEKRGNYWHWEHERSALAFRDMDEEAAFYTSLGKRMEVRNPATGLYSWTRPELINALHQGLGDYATTHSPTVHSVSLYHFPDVPEFGKRLREKTLLDFARNPFSAVRNWQAKVASSR